MQGFEILLHKKVTSKSELEQSVFARNIIALLSTDDIVKNKNTAIESIGPFIIDITDEFVTLIYRNNKCTIESIIDLFRSYDATQELISSSEIVNTYTYKINRHILTNTLLHKIEINDFRPFEFLINSN